MSRRANKAPFVMLRKDVLRSLAYRALSYAERSFLIDLAEQFRGNNNGDMTAAFAVMRRKGWTSKSTVQRCIRRLLDAGFIEQTRQGGRNRCSLYALTWFAIDDCKGKLDRGPTCVASNSWKNYDANKRTAYPCERGTQALSAGQS